VDILAVQPTVNTAYAMNDSSNRNQHLGGVYVTTPLIGPLKADLYALNYENNSVKMRNISGPRSSKLLARGFSARRPDSTGTPRVLCKPASSEI